MTLPFPPASLRPDAFPARTSGPCEDQAIPVDQRRAVFGKPAKCIVAAASRDETAMLKILHAVQVSSRDAAACVEPSWHASEKPASSRNDR